MTVRIFQPFPILMRGGKLELPVNMQVNIEDHGVAGIDDPIAIQYNSVGLRGPEPPESTDTLSVLCVGGSTTQCVYLSDGKTWPDVLAQQLSTRFDKVWVNNAGLDGHSTHGHLFLLEHLAWLRPKVILFYVGINDVDRTDLNESDSDLNRAQSHEGEGPLKTVYRFCLGKSELLTTLDMLRRQNMARKRGLIHHATVDHAGLAATASLQLTDAEREAGIESSDPGARKAYGKRLEQLIQAAKACGSIPVFITQPALYGDAIDPVTELDLSRVQVGEDDGFVAWKKLQSYNDITRSIAAQHGILCIDIAKDFPSRASISMT